MCKENIFCLIINNRAFANKDRDNFTSLYAKNFNIKIVSLRNEVGRVKNWENKQELFFYNIEKSMHAKENTNSANKIIIKLKSLCKTNINKITYKYKKSEIIWTHYGKLETSNMQWKIFKYICMRKRKIYTKY